MVRSKDPRTLGDATKPRQYNSSIFKTCTTVLFSSCLNCFHSESSINNLTTSPTSLSQSHSERRNAAQIVHLKGVLIRPFQSREGHSDSSRSRYILDTPLRVAELVFPSGKFSVWAQDRLRCIQLTLYIRGTDSLNGKYSPSVWWNRCRRKLLPEVIHT